MTFPIVSREEGRKLILVTTLLILASGGLLVGVRAASLTGGNHVPILIAADSDFTSSGSTTGCACVSEGTGTADNPFIIGPWTIMATLSGPGVLIDGTSLTKFFTLSHVTIHGTTQNDGIVFTHVTGLGPHGEHFDTITAANVDGARTGILLDNTDGVTITGNSVNNSFDWGIEVANSHDNTVTFMTAAHNGLSNPGPTDPLSGNAFLQIGVTGGVLFVDSSYNELSRSQLSEDGYAGFMFVRADHNSLFDVHARYPDYFGGVLQDSSNNTLNRIGMQTADFSGLLIRGGGFNTVENSTFSANGPIGNEIQGQVVPYFISGIYLGWGTHDNRIILNHSNNGNTGPSLIVDDGTVVNPVQAPTQDLNPLNNAVGNDPGLVPATSMFDAGQSTAVGSGNVYCGNSFPSTNLPTNPNQPC
jgi:parallel beta-helix repeat protein